MKIITTLLLDLSSLPAEKIRMIWREITALEAVAWLSGSSAEERKIILGHNANQNALLIAGFGLMLENIKKLTDEPETTYKTSLNVAPGNSYLWLINRAGAVVLRLLTISQPEMAKQPPG